MTAPVPRDGLSVKTRQSMFEEFETKRLTDEYKIIQDKIDKIGAFKFIIKGWSVTVVIAALAAGKATNLPIIDITVGLVSMLCYFFFLEFQQVKISRILGGRARKLEKRFRTIDRESSRSVVFPSPYIAHEIALAHHNVKPKKKGTRLVPTAPSDRWKIARQADMYFYILLVILALAFALVVKDTSMAQFLPSSQQQGNDAPARILSNKATTHLPENNPTHRNNP